MTNQKTLVLALGNPLRGDDGIGAEIFARLDKKCRAEQVDLIESGTPGLETVLLLQGYQRAIIIDAADMESEPGSWRRFRLDEVTLSKTKLGGTLHSVGLAEALALGAALNMLPEEIIIYGIQPADTEWKIGLSSAVNAAIPAVTCAIMHDLGQMT